MLFANIPCSSTKTFMIVSNVHLIVKIRSAFAINANIQSFYAKNTHSVVHCTVTNITSKRKMEERNYKQG